MRLSKLGVSSGLEPRGSAGAGLAATFGRNVTPIDEGISEILRGRGAWRALCPAVPRRQAVSRPDTLASDFGPARLTPLLFAPTENAVDFAPSAILICVNEFSRKELRS